MRAHVLQIQLSWLRKMGRCSRSELLTITLQSIYACQLWQGLVCVIWIPMTHWTRLIEISQETGLLQNNSRQTLNTVKMFLSHRNWDVFKRGCQISQSSAWVTKSCEHPKKVDDTPKKSRNAGAKNIATALFSVDGEFIKNIKPNWSLGNQSILLCQVCQANWKVCCFVEWGAQREIPDPTMRFVA